MPNYRYRAVYPSGRKFSGMLDVINEAELIDFLGRSGLELIEAKAEKRRAPSGFGLPLRRKLAAPILAQFAAQMTDLLGAGLTLIDALGDIAATSFDKALRQALEQVIRDIRNGSAIPAAFQARADLFPPIFLSILASGEASGDLVRTFAYLKEYTAARARMGDNLRRATRYPIFLICVALGVVSFMMTMVVPQIIQFLQSIDGQLPIMTRLLITVSNACLDQGWLMALCFAVMVILGLALHRFSSAAALAIDRLLLRLPALGPTLRNLALARFTHSFGILYQSSRNAPDSLAKAKSTVHNRYLQAQLDHAARQLQNGQPLSSALRDLFPPYAARILRIGEQSGQLGKSLMDIAQSCDRQATDRADRFVGSLEPALTMLVGSILAWIVLAVFGPIYGSLTRLVGNG